MEPTNNIAYGTGWENKVKKVKTYVVHNKKSPYNIYIGRPSKWGNPFTIGRDGTREEVIEKYKEWLLTQPKLLEDLRELRGKVLGCWCKPMACHGDVLADMADNIEGSPEEQEL